MNTWLTFTSALPTKLAQFPVGANRYLFASAKYLDEKGVPYHPDDLVAHSAFALGQGTTPSWSLRFEDEPAAIVPITTRFVSNDMVALKQAACAGLGMVALPGYVCREELAMGRLVRVVELARTHCLPSWPPAMRGQFLMSSGGSLSGRLTT